MGSNMRHVLPNSELMRSVFYKLHGENSACNLCFLQAFCTFPQAACMKKMYEKWCLTHPEDQPLIFF